MRPERRQAKKSPQRRLAKSSERTQEVIVSEELTGSTPSSEIGPALARAYCEFKIQAQSIYERYHRACLEEWRARETGFAVVWKAACRRAREAEQTLRRSLDESALNAPDERARTVSAAQSNYSKAIHDAGDEYTKSAEDHHTKSCESFGNIATDAKASLQKAYDNYLAAVRELLEQATPMTPRVLLRFSEDAWRVAHEVGSSFCMFAAIIPKSGAPPA